MSDLTEHEVIDRLKSSLQEAGQASIELSLLPRKGPSYRKLREHLLLVEGCCRQLSAMREDTRWLMVGMQMAEAHRRAGGWLRGFKFQGRRIYMTEAQRHPMFQKLAENLAALLVGAEQLQHQRTGVRGAILPETPVAHREVGAPVPVKLPDGMTKSAGGIILPATVH